MGFNSGLKGLISSGGGQIMETLDKIGIKLFVLFALKEH
jgi:hypothetical protein